MGGANSKNAMAAKKRDELCVLHVLGRGAHSDVVLAEDRATHKLFAIKRIAIGARKSKIERKGKKNFFFSFLPRFNRNCAGTG
jgi:serine/threonine protein kinase